MNKLKNALIILVGTILLIVLIGFLLPRKVHIERNISVRAPAGLIFDQINILENWKNWSPWLKIDTLIKINYEGKSGKGSGYSWQSLYMDLGNGSMTITESKPNEFIAIEMDFRGKGKSSSYFRFETMVDTVSIYWGLDKDLGPNPFIRYFEGMLRKRTIKSFEEGLISLKELCEKLANEGSGLNIHIGRVSVARYFTIEATCKMSELGPKIAELFSLIMNDISKHNIHITGPPVVIYKSFSSEATDFIAGIPFSGSIKNEGKFKIISLADGNAVIADYYGSYNKIGSAYKVIQKWIETKSKIITGSSWEEYITDPSMEKDTSRWLTRIYYPVK